MKSDQDKLIDRLSKASTTQKKKTLDFEKRLAAFQDQLKSLENGDTLKMDCQSCSKEKKLAEKWMLEKQDQTRKNIDLQAQVDKLKSQLNTAIF